MFGRLAMGFAQAYTTPPTPHQVRILGRRAASFSPFLIPHRVPRGFTPKILVLTSPRRRARHAALDGEDADRGGAQEAARGEPFYPPNHAGCGWGISNSAMGAARLPKILVLKIDDFVSAQGGIMSKCSIM